MAAISVLQLEYLVGLFFIYLVGVIALKIYLFKKCRGELRKSIKIQFFSLITTIVLSLLTLIIDSSTSEGMVFAFISMFIILHYIYLPNVLTECEDDNQSDELKMNDYEKVSGYYEKINGWLFFFLWIGIALISIGVLYRAFGSTESYGYTSEIRKMSGLVYFAFAVYAVIAFYKRKKYAVSCFYYYAAVVFVSGVLSTLVTIANVGSDVEYFLPGVFTLLIVYVVVLLPFILYPLYSEKINRMFPKTCRKHDVIGIVFASAMVLFNILAAYDEINWVSNGKLLPGLFNNKYYYYSEHINNEYETEYESEYEEEETSDVYLDEVEVKDVTVNGVDIKLVFICRGTFDMGATDEQGDDAGSDERPVHSVEINHDFYIGQTEVTQELWEAVMSSNPSKHVGDDLPVEMVSWDDCQIFIEKLNGLTDMHFRLPTEEEWEYASRGGSLSNVCKYSGSDNLEEVGWSSGNAGNQSHSVGKKLPNEVGLFDMSGNVYEWCQSRYNSYDDQAASSSNNKGDERVRRGGSWRTNNNCCRVSFRGNSKHIEKRDDIGLRIVLDI